MLGEPCRRRPAAAPSRARTLGPDAGFTLTEMMVSIAVVAILMTAMALFFLRSLGVMNFESGRQSAIQLAQAGTERVRGLQGSAVATGRDQTSSDAQWTAAGPRVSPYLASMNKTWDSGALSGAGASAKLPTVAEPLTLDGVAYSRNTYVGTCWQPAGGGTCGSANQPGYVAFYRVVVAVTWKDRTCTGSCAYVTSTLVSSASSDPIFNSNLSAQAPVLNTPAAQSTQVQSTVSLQLTATGGALPLSWDATGRPPGLTINASTGLLAGTPTVLGTYTVFVSATDQFGLVGTTSFNWTITPIPLKITTPPTQTGMVGTAVTPLQIMAQDGTQPYTSWSASGLPSGLSINSSTGRITGTPTASGTWNSVVVTVTDSAGKTASTAAFRWSVNPALAITVPATATRTNTKGNSVSLQSTATGGAPSYTWSATGLPTGLAISANGLISGTAGTLGTFTTTVTVTDSLGYQKAVTFTWRVI